MLFGHAVLIFYDCMGNYEIIFPKWDTTGTPRVTTFGITYIGESSRGQLILVSHLGTNVEMGLRNKVTGFQGINHSSIMTVPINCQRAD
jgi:hypothetical protein